jgi:hypothetical protein
MKARVTQIERRTSADVVSVEVVSRAGKYEKKRESDLDDWEDILNPTIH